MRPTLVPRVTTVGATNSRAFEGHAHRDEVSSQNATKRHLKKRERNMTRNTDVKKMQDGDNDEDVPK